jgi:ribosome-associated protein
MKPASSTATALARTAARAADDKKGTDTVIFDVSAVIVIAEAFVVTSANNRRLVRTIADAVEDQLRLEHGRSPLRIEGLSDQQWVLIDYGDVVVHVFAEEQRRFYEIERLYRDAPAITWEPTPPVVLL